jgi:hypothetical protein
MAPPAASGPARWGTCVRRRGSRQLNGPPAAPVALPTFPAGRPPNVSCRQDGVPEAIAGLKAAGIKVWVLTGERGLVVPLMGSAARSRLPLWTEGVG